jgi:hypothetical protein
MTIEENSSSVNGSRASGLGSWVGNSVAFPALHKGYNSTAKNAMSRRTYAMRLLLELRRAHLAMVGRVRRDGRGNMFCRTDQSSRLTPKFRIRRMPDRRPSTPIAILSWTFGPDLDSRPPCRPMTVTRFTSGEQPCATGL